MPRGERSELRGVEEGVSERDIPERPVTSSVARDACSRSTTRCSLAHVPHKKTSGASSDVRRTAKSPGAFRHAGQQRERYNARHALERHALGGSVLQPAASWRPPLVLAANLAEDISSLTRAHRQHTTLAMPARPDTRDPSLRAHAFSCVSRDSTSSV